MSSFLDPLVVSLDDDGRTWTLQEPFTYVEGDLATGVHLDVPKGFMTDFASIPQIFWNILPPVGKYGKAAVLHDWLYSTAKYERARCDAIFFEAMGVLGVTWWVRWTLYIGVRTGGWYAWQKHRAKDIAKPIISPLAGEGGD